MALYIVVRSRRLQAPERVAMDLTFDDDALARAHKAPFSPFPDTDHSRMAGTGPTCPLKM